MDHQSNKSIKKLSIFTERRFLQCVYGGESYGEHFYIYTKSIKKVSYRTRRIIRVINIPRKYLYYFIYRRIIRVINISRKYLDYFKYGWIIRVINTSIKKCLNV